MDSQNNVEIVEKVDFESNAEWKKKKLLTTIYQHLEKKMNPENGRWHLKRNLIDDTFDFCFYPHYITIEPNIGVRDFDFFKLNFNNTFFINTPRNIGIPEYDTFTDYQLMKLPTKHLIKVHRSVLKNFKFKNLETFFWSMGRYAFVQPKIIYYSFLKSFNKFKFITNASEHYLNSNQVIKFKSIKNIFVQSSDHEYTEYSKDYASYVDRNNIEIKKATFKIEYNEIYLKPSPIKKYIANRKIFDIYFKNPNNEYERNHFIYDYLLKNIRYRSSGITKWENLIFKPKWEKDNYYKNATKIGEISFEKPTFYDYKKQAVIVGYEKDTQELGEILPYNFNGVFKREIELDINSAFKKHKINLLQSIDKPILDPYNGDWRLNIKNDIPNQINDKLLSLDVVYLPRIKKNLNNPIYGKNFIMDLVKNEKKA